MMNDVAAAVLPLPAASVATFAGTFTVTGPPAVGVMLNVYVAPEPLKLPMVPLPTVMLPAIKPVTLSENVTVNGMGEVLVVLPLAPAELVITTVGAVVSTVKVLVLLSTLVLPAASAARAFTVCEPLARPVEGVKLQLPLASAVVVATGVPSTITVTVVPDSAVPE